MPRISDWYLSLATTVVDLVGDYAGKELFLIEGDSLVLQCFDDSKLDFEDGFQLLQAVWNVERFLSKLIRAKCNFHIVFFNENRNLSTPSFTEERSREKYRLARDIIYHHLENSVQNQFPELVVKTFESISSQEFHDHLRSVGVYFVMCHNGVLQNIDPDDVDDAKAAKALQRKWYHVIKQFMSFNFNVATINEIEWRDTKVITSILQFRSATGLISLENGESNEEAEETEEDSEDEDDSEDEEEEEEDEDETDLQILQPGGDISAREHLGLSVLTSLLSESEDSFYPFAATGFILQLACMRHMSLAERRLPDVEINSEDQDENFDEFVTEFCQTARKILKDPNWKKFHPDGDKNGNLQDLMDGRLLRLCLYHLGKGETLNLPEQVSKSFNSLLDSLTRMVEEFNRDSSVKLDAELEEDAEGQPQGRGLLPFNNKVVNTHLADIHVDVRKPTKRELAQGKVSNEKTHWHNRRPLDPKLTKDLQKSFTKWKNPARRNQIQMREMLKYAASLTNSRGKVLTPETISVGTLKPTAAESEEKRIKSGNKKAVLSKKDKITEQNQALKLRREEEKWVESWKHQVTQLEKMANLDKRLTEATLFFDKLDGQKKDFLKPEVKLYILQILIRQWQTYSLAKNDRAASQFAGMVWDNIRGTRASPGRMTKDCLRALEKVCSKLDLPELPKMEITLLERPLSFRFDLQSISDKPLSGDVTIQEFQLLHCGPYMDRHTNSKPDRRVDFEPDEWQRKVLDELDLKHSVFVVAPTSAGKTFISFYAMEQVLREGNDGILIYVAPTKALVNQIGAEIQGRFSKKYPNSERTVWAIHTRDHRVNKPENCQILVTVPHILQIMLLAPSNAKTWAPRVKCIIFDEIHSIGNADDGLVWEQLLLLSPCRIIALSATVGNPDEFNDWLSSTQKILKVPMTMVRYKYRYSDLRKFVFKPRPEPAFTGLPAICSLAETTELDAVPDIDYIHPVTGLVCRSHGVPEDMSLEPRDCLLLWRTMVKHQTPEFPISPELHPTRALPAFIRKIDIFKWEDELKQLLAKWMEDNDSPFDKVREELEVIQSAKLESPSTPSTPENEEDNQAISKKSMVKGVLPLLVRLHRRNALPAILFNYERSTCEDIAFAVLSELTAAEERYKQGSAWKKQVADWEEWKIAKEKQSKKKEVKGKKGKAGDERQSKEDAMRDNASSEGSAFDSFDPDKPLDQFTFADVKKSTREELEEDLKDLRWVDIRPQLLDALRRGIGVHHAGMNRRYRQVVERLFRKGFLRVVIATGTLALGINMPCSTVVFCGDSVFLTALNFRQAAGRAGRRGFDLLGNVIFHGIPTHKIHQLLSSRLPDLNGHFPITTSLILRLFILLNNSKNSEYAVQVVNTLLTQPRLVLGGEEFKAQVLHHLRFSIEYLRGQFLLGPKGEPLDLAGCISHLYYTEHSAFAFHALLRSGYFKNLIKQHKNDNIGLMETMMIVMAHLFGRKPLGSRYHDLVKHGKKIESPSIVILPNLPEDANEILEAHNQESLTTYANYVDTFVKQHLVEVEGELPLTSVKVGGEGNSEVSKIFGAKEANTSRSAFVGLSGYGDKFETISDLCETVRSGVFLEQSVVPHLELYPGELKTPLNAYLYDFFKHGSQIPLETANRIPRSDSWFHLNDFSLVLATIVTGLANYLGLTAEQTLNPGDIMGAGEINDDEGEDRDDKNDQVTQLPIHQQAPASKPEPTPVPQLQHHNEESDEEDIPDEWDAGASDDEKKDEDSEDDYAGDEEPAVTEEVFKAFRQLQTEFNEKFHAIFA
ncbi:putative ATP-dependent RNA helicase ddx60 [Arachnomyces sp. PD_36]|nr:putative ATP-dependent RNA helicase ddx60 [Arachnomyces sp. PD_36]